MRIFKFFIAVSLIFSFAFLTFGQDKKKSDEDKKSESNKAWEEEQRREEQDRRIEELNERLKEAQRSQYIDLRNYLPKPKDSWVVSITSTGGFAGGTRLLAGVDSDGNSICTLDGNLTKTVLAKNISDELLPFLKNLRFSKWDYDDVKLPVCNDCTYMTLTYQSRNGVYRYSRYDLSMGDNEIQNIYAKIINAADCSKSPVSVQ